MSTNIGRTTRKVRCQYCGTRYAPGEHTPCPMIVGTPLVSTGETHTLGAGCGGRCVTVDASDVTREIDRGERVPMAPDAVTTPDTIAASVRGLAEQASAMLRRGHEPRITGYLVQATVQETRTYGRAADPATYTAAVQVPTFILPVDVLGITSAEHAERIARGMFPTATSVVVAPVTRL